MHAAPDQASMLSLPSIAEISNLIESSLSHDWILRVEHSDSSPSACTQWQEWGESAFAVTEAAPIIDRIVACRASFPTHNIRLHAEKVRPRTRMYYPVYRRSEHEPEAAPVTLDPTAALPHRNEWFSTLGKGARAVRARAWQVAALVGMLFVSLLMIEETLA